MMLLPPTHLLHSPTSPPTHPARGTTLVPTDRPESERRPTNRHRPPLPPPSFVPCFADATGV
eukprot:748289-Prymnesium_polylepis.3